MTSLDHPRGVTRIDTPTREKASSTAGGVGLLLGLAAATTGVASFVPMFGVRPWHIFAGLAFGCAILASPAGTFRRLRIGMLDITFALFVLGSLMAEYVNSNEFGKFDFVGAINPIFYMVGYLAARIIVTNKKAAYQLLLVFCVPAIPAAFVSVIQLGSVAFSRMVLRIAPGPGLEGRIIDGRLIRATGFVGHWTGLGFYFCSVLAAACAVLLLARDLNSRVPRVLYVAMGAATLGVVASLTLSAIVTALVIAIATLVVVGIKPSRILVLAGVSLGLYFQFGSYLEERVTQQTAYRKEYVPSWVPNTIAYRWKIWTEQTVPVLMDRPWSGWGSNLYSSGYRPRILVWGSPESQWLGTAITSGLVVAGLLASAIIITIILLFKGTTVCRYMRWQLPIAALVLGALVSSFTVPVFTNRGLPVGMWVIVGVVLAVQIATRGATDEPKDDETAARLERMSGR